MPRYRNTTGIALEDYRKECLTSAQPFTAVLCNLSDIARRFSPGAQLELVCTDTEEVEHCEDWSDDPMISEIDVAWDIKLAGVDIGTITVNRSTCYYTKRETVYQLDASIDMDRETVMEALSGIPMEFEDWEYQNDKEFRVSGHWYNANMYGYGILHNKMTDYENVDKAFYALINWVARAVTRQVNADFRILQKDLESLDLETPS